MTATIIARNRHLLYANDRGIPSQMAPDFAGEISFEMTGKTSAHPRESLGNYLPEEVVPSQRRTS